MAARLNGDTLRWLGTLHREGSVSGMSDGQLLERFLSSHGSPSEAAFEALVRRHGPTVLALCRGVLRDDHDSDDAFQATFLVLARRAATIRDRGRLATWLGRVARRIALRSREEAAHLQALEGRRVEFDVVMGETTAAPVAIAVETAALVRAEVDRLPDPDRLLMRLTYWQGKTYEEAASVLSWPIGTVRSRLSRVRERLRGPLTRRGLAPLLAAAFSGATVKEASAAPLREALILQTVHGATRYAGGITAAVEAGAVPANVAVLLNGELSTMATISWKSIAVLLLLGATVTTGVASLTLPASDAAAAEPTMPLVADSEPVTATILLASQQKAESKSLLANSGVEEGAGDSPKAWTAGATIPGVDYIWSRDTGHTGKASLCLKKTAQRYFPIAQWSQNVDRKGDNPRLEVSAWVKAEKASKAILDVQFIDGDGKWTHAWVAYIGAKEANDPPVSHDWKRYEGIVAIPPATKQIVIAPQIYGPGTVWFDDLDAEYTNDPATNPIGS
jgi:RNA polymerase sigma-70 factor (ECF subfamily)